MKSKRRVNRKTINISELELNKEIPTDVKLSRILQDVYSKKAPCYLAIIKMEGFKLFSDYKPKPSSSFPH